MSLKPYEPTSFCIKMRELLVERANHELPVEIDNITTWHEIAKLTVSDYRYLEGVIFGLNN